MATSTSNSRHLRSGDDGDSDYGSDFSVGEELLVDRLLQSIASGSHAPPSLALADLARHPAAVPPPFASGLVSPAATDDNKSILSLDSIRYPDLSHALSNLKAPQETDQTIPLPPVKSPVEQPFPTVKGEALTPLQRFRAFPKRPLTVSDVVSGAWCELQHFYTLALLPHGRKTRNAAMRGGSRVHQTLEDEVHQTVRVEITTKEEAFALRLWNVIQGLRTLRETGLTRELEVWGFIHREPVNGVIDQLSHKSPDANWEEELSNSSAPSTQQSSITDYLLSSSHKTVYLTDVKTRGSDKLPSGTAFRPARVQLLVYYRLLADMAADRLDYDAVLDRYGLDGSSRFSDAFIAQIGNLHDEIFYDADSAVAENTSDDSSSVDFIRYRSVTQLITLLKSELKTTFPAGPESIGNLLAVEYRHRDDGRVLGKNTFLNDPEGLDAYIKHTLRWWRGEREPDGVAIEETYKCGWCEFAEGCQWRKDKEAEFLEKKRGSKVAGGRFSREPSVQSLPAS
ncbi:exonuclease V [Xylariaceae sp. FL0255]|nr:exonuclease V [Xylariaceae sp. FL0255]